MLQSSMNYQATAARSHCALIHSNAQLNPCIRRPTALSSAPTRAVSYHYSCSACKGLQIVHSADAYNAFVVPGKPQMLFLVHIYIATELPKDFAQIQ
eukprot:1160440-Pelagomonas_calceolata.AAC.8